MKRNTLWKALFVLYCAVMLWLLFDREVAYIPGQYWQQVLEQLNPVPFETILLYIRALDSDRYRATAIINLFGNVGMFLPLGFFLPLLWQRLRKWWKSWLAAFCIMLLVELAQLFSLRGYFDVDDLILNVLGAAIGYGFYRIYAKLTVK